MIVHRLLDAVFRTLDTVDAIRARVDAALTREAQPPSSWPAVIGAARSERTSFDVDAARDIYATTTVDTWRGDSSHDENATPSDAPVVPSTTTTTTPTKTSDAHGAPAQVATKATTKATKAPTKAPTKASTTKTGKTGKATKKTAAKAAAADTRKGSVDRVGKDLDSVRATEIAGWLATHPQPVVTEAAAIDGKRTVARLVWAVSVAQQAGHTDGLTAADASALLSSIAHVEVFATNVARAFRDEQALFVETSVDGRSKRYALTAAGKKRLADVEVA